jgi:hypothetical protein
MRKILTATLAVGLFLSMTGCIYTFRRVEVTPAGTGRHATPIKAHMDDGSLVLFPDGAKVRDDGVEGRGFRYDVGLNYVGEETVVPFDGMAALTCFRDGQNETASVLVSMLATSVVAAAAVVAVILPCSDGGCFDLGLSGLALDRATRPSPVSGLRRIPPGGGR